MVRLVALDLDGTLLNSRGRVSDADAAAVKAAAERGVVVVLATARWFATAGRWAERLGISGPMICHSGALVRDSATGRRYVDLRLDADLARRVAALGDERGYTMFTTVGDVTYMRVPDGAPRDRLPPDLRPCDRHAAAVTEAPSGILVFGRAAMDEICDRFQAEYGDRARFGRNLAPGFADYLTLTHPDADKGRALTALCAELGIDPSEAMAVGDAEGDAAMFEVVRHGIAMGNAGEAVKARAADVAPGHDEDGVAWAIRKYVLGE